MKLLKTIIFFIILIAIVTYINKKFFDIYNDIQMKTKKNLIDYSKYIFLYVPIMFWLASRAIYFDHSDGFFQLYITKAIESVSKHENYYKNTTFFAGGISIIAIYIFSLLATASGSSVGDEGVIIYSSISLLLYFYFKLKDSFDLKNIYTEFIIYLGFAVGFTIVYGSLISTFLYVLEHMIINKDKHFFSNFGLMLCAIPFIYYLVGEKDNLIKLNKLTFDVKSYGYIALFAVVIGIISFLFFKSLTMMFNYIKKTNFNNIYVIGCGFLLAFIIKKLGFLTMGVGEDAINEAFQAVYNKEKIEKLEKENNYYELEKLRKLEKEGKFDTTLRFNVYSVFGRIINCIISIGSGLTGGLVIPAMTIGCGLGSVLSKYTSIPEDKLMYLGMPALLSPFLDAPVTSAFVINRISNQPYSSLPISLAVSFISYFTYHFIDKRIK